MKNFNFLLEKGDFVKTDDLVAEIETDKVNFLIHLKNFFTRKN